MAALHALLRPRAALLHKQDVPEPLELKVKEQRDFLGKR